MSMLDANLADQLKTYLVHLQRPIVLEGSFDDSDNARQLQALLIEVSVLSDKITFVSDGNDQRKPSFSVNTPDGATKIRFAGIPLGHEFTSLVLALLQVGGHPLKITDELITQIKELTGNYRFETYISLSCQNCPDVVQALNIMALLNPNVSHTMIDGALFQDEVERLQIMAVPTVYLNGQEFGQGRMALEEIVGKLDSNAGTKTAEKISAKEPFDVLVIGGGPAGAAAAIYAARKGIRTGIVAERFGGQVLDTLSIENFISVQETEGPKLVMALEEHVKAYDVDIMNLQTVQQIVPAANKGGLHQITCESGATLQAKTIIIATGARWREMGVPGENEYRTKGVAFCPHCDGPLFKGKPIAVIGGGNSGVEAAIDLAGIVKHVTLLEFAETLKADAVLQNKLRSLPNVTIIANAQTSKVDGDGNKVTGLEYTDRATGDNHHLDLDAIFVQIGLLPNTLWLKDTLELSPLREIVINARGETSIPGIFAAGDVTTVPYKQIIIAMGEGSKASLSAFDYLIRN